MPASIAQHARIKRFSFIFLASPLICSAQVYAKPDMRPLGPNIADKGSVFYHFSATSFDSVDGTPLSGMDGRAEYNRTGIGLPDFIYA